MAEWNIITDVVGRALSVVAMGPAGLALNPVGNSWKLADHLFGPAPDKVVPAQAPPYPGTSPQGEPPPGMEWSQPGVPPGAPPPPPPPPPNGPDGASGEAADAAAADAADVNRMLMELHELDKRAAETVDAVAASGQLVKKTMEDIARDVDAKITEMGDRLNTPEGQKELRDFLKERLQTAKDVLTNAVSYAEECARKTQEMTQSYSDIGGAQGGSGAGGGETAGGGGGDTGGGSGGGSGGGGTGGGGEPSTPPGTQPASTTPAGMPMGMPGGMMPGMGGMPSLPSLPSFGGGGGMPGMSDPLGALGGLGSGTPGGQPLGMHDEAAGTEDPTATEAPTVHDDATAPGDEPGGGDAGTTDEAGAVAAAHETDSTEDEDATTEPAGNSVPGQTAAADPADATTGTSVKLPSGLISEARTEAGAGAARAALEGDTVEQAYAKFDISVPPPGTPVTDPVPPTELKAGDIGIWKDHLVMALGNNKVLVSGQEQPLDSVGSGPDFMGWLDPTKQHSAGQGQGQAEQPPAPGSTGA